MPFWMLWPPPRIAPIPAAHGGAADNGKDVTMQVRADPLQIARIYRTVRRKCRDHGDQEQSQADRQPLKLVTRLHDELPQSVEVISSEVGLDGGSRIADA